MVWLLGEFGTLGIGNDNVVFVVWVWTCGNVFGGVPELWGLLVLNDLWFGMFWFGNWMMELLCISGKRRASVDLLYDQSTDEWDFCPPVGCFS